jgi:cysteine desulfurase/selenocysteine lyase
MTTLTPTSEAQAAGLPDLGALAQLASEFFRALPGETGRAPGLPPGLSGISGLAAPGAPSVQSALSPSLPSVPALPALPPTTLPSSPQSLTLGVPGPRLSPQATAPNGLPDAATTSLPGAGRAGGGALGVPEAYAPSLPALGGLPAFPQDAAPTAGTPFYFLQGTDAGVTAPAAPAAATPDLPAHGGDRVTAQSFGLPGADELRSLLAGSSREPVSPVTSASKPGSGFYFLQPAQDVPQAGAGARPPFDVNAVRRDFPILAERVNGKPLIWFDNAATTHKPQAVIDRLAYFYAHENSNIHRAAHELAARATDAYESARKTVQRFIGAGSVDEIIFVRGATEAINLVAKSWGAKHIGAGDEIIVSHLEHHANIVPWQQLASEKGATIRVIPVDDTGQVLLEEYRKLLNDKTKLVAVTQVSNALGTVVPVKEIVELAHRAGACALVDGAQSVSHLRVNVQALDADFFVFSGHKIFGPTGIGVVYGKKARLEDMPPWQGGGNMIQDVTFERTVFQPPPNKFEAGTGNIADAVGLGAALDYVDRIGLENIARYEHDLLVYAMHGLQRIPGVRLVGTAADKASVASFVLAGYSTEEVGQALNEEGVAVRSGHHCAQPILRRFGLETTVRPSFAFYNTCEEIDVMLKVVRRLAGSRRAV